MGELTIPFVFYQAISNLLSCFENGGVGVDISFLWHLNSAHSQQGGDPLRLIDPPQPTASYGPASNPTFSTCWEIPTLSGPTADTAKCLYVRKDCMCFRSVVSVSSRQACLVNDYLVNLIYSACPGGDVLETLNRRVWFPRLKLYTGCEVKCQFITYATNGGCTLGIMDHWSDQVKVYSCVLCWLRNKYNLIMIFLKWAVTEIFSEGYLHYVSHSKIKQVSSGILKTFNPTWALASSLLQMLWRGNHYRNFCKGKKLQKGGGKITSVTEIHDK